MGERIKFRVVPNAPKSTVVGAYGDAVKIKLKAQPVDGKANAELVKFLSKALDISRNSINIVSGDTSKDKIVEFDSIDNVYNKLLDLSS